MTRDGEDQDRTTAADSGADKDSVAVTGDASPVDSEAVALEEAAAASPARVAELEAALAAAQASAAEHKEQWLRALAESENIRRRTQRDKQDALKYAIADFARDLLPAADNLRRALAAIPQEALEGDEALRQLKTGVELTERLMQSALERHNIKRIDPVGEKFDSNFHQALFEVANSSQPGGTVVQVLEPGYLLHDRLLRPASVSVAKTDAAENAADAPANTNEQSGASESPAPSAGD